MNDNACSIRVHVTIDYGACDHVENSTLSLTPMHTRLRCRGPVFLWNLLTFLLTYNKLFLGPQMPQPGMYGLTQVT